MKTKTIVPLILAAGLAVLLGCAGPETETTETPDAGPDLDHLFLAQKPSNATPVAAIVADPVEGAEVTVAGKIGGAVDVFGKGYAVFFLADDSVYFCDEMPEDTCPTPWDACCEDPDKLAESRLLVQFTDDSGEVLPVHLEGVNGLAGLDTVTVKGTVISGRDGVVTIDADGIYREAGETPASG